MTSVPFLHARRPAGVLADHLALGQVRVLLSTLGSKPASAELATPRDDSLTGRARRAPSRASRPFETKSVTTDSHSTFSPAGGLGVDDVVPPRRPFELTSSLRDLEVLVLELLRRVGRGPPITPLDGIATCRPSETLISTSEPSSARRPAGGSCLGRPSPARRSSRSPDATHLEAGVLELVRRRPARSRRSRTAPAPAPSGSARTPPRRRSARARTASAISFLRGSSPPPPCSGGGPPAA